MKLTEPVDLSPHQIENAKEYIRPKEIIKKEGNNQYKIPTIRYSISSS